MSRELPVLDTVVRLLEGKPEASMADIAAETGLELDAVGRALIALEGPYLSNISKPWGFPPSGWRVLAVTPGARRAIGQWPTPETIVDQLAEAFAAAAEKEPDLEKKSRLHQVAGFFTSAGRDIATDVVAKIVGRALGAG